MARSLLLAAFCGVASAAPLDDAAVFVQRTAIQTDDSDNGDTHPLVAPLMSGFKNVVRTLHDINVNEAEGNPNSTMSITGSAIKRALPAPMQDLVEDVAEVSIKEHWGKKNQTGNDIIARILQLAWSHGQEGQQKLGQAVQNVMPEEARAKHNRVMGKLDLLRKTVSDRVNLFSQAAQQTLPGVMQQVYGATQQAFQAAQAAQQGPQQQQQQPLPWGPQAGQQPMGPQAMQAQQQYMPQMQQPQQAMQMMPQQMPYGMMPQQMQYGAMPPQQMQYGAMPPQQMPMQQWAPQMPQA